MRQPGTIRRIIFVSSRNAVRSPMAEALVNSLFPGRYEAVSAGTEPGAPDPLVKEVLEEAGFEISPRQALSVGEVSRLPVHFVVTLCDRAAKVCPLFPNAAVSFHKGFEEPPASPSSTSDRRDAYRRLRDELRAWVEQTFG